TAFASNQVAPDPTRAYLNVVAADKVLQSLKAGLDQAREDHRLASLRYEVGVGTSLEVLRPRSSCCASSPSTWRPCTTTTWRS
ncbi:MAG: TolC family protein, partial [Firmicutes bacterium]|nr:TolC family protein [Bacillota bacterium]